MKYYNENIYASGKSKIDFNKLEVEDAYIDGGSFKLSEGAFNGNWVEANAKDKEGKTYRAIWTKCDFSINFEDCCDWENPDYVIAKDGEEFINDEFYKD